MPGDELIGIRRLSSLEKSLKNSLKTRPREFALVAAKFEVQTLAFKQAYNREEQTETIEFAEIFLAKAGRYRGKRRFKF